MQMAAVLRRQIAPEDCKQNNCCKFLLLFLHAANFSNLPKQEGRPNKKKEDKIGQMT